VASETVDIESIRRAADRIGGRLHRTPLLSSRLLGEAIGARVVVKAELFQRTGSFKPRGVLNRLAGLSAAEREHGVVSFSAGNHAQAVAWACAQEGVRCRIFMPAGASAAKVEATRAYGGEVDLSCESAAEAGRRAVELSERGWVLVHPFDHPAVIAGQGTVGAELVADAGELDLVVVPASGGGLVAGVSSAIAATFPEARVVAAQIEANPTIREALAAGRPVVGKPEPTMADALTAPFVGDHCLPLIQAHVHDVACVTEDELAAAMRFVYGRLKLAAEPGGVVGVAALLAGRVRPEPGARVAVVVSGGNVDPRLVAQALDR
jgi:threo-3-hydroxy-L-aspartate ammonia-lyase